MRTADLGNWSYDPVLAVAPSHQKWSATISFGRRYKLRGFPDLSSSPVVALCSLELTAGNPALVKARVLRRVTDTAASTLEDQVREKLESREPSADAILQGDSLGPRWCGTEFLWFVSGAGPQQVEDELEFLHSLFSGLRVPSRPLAR